MKSGYTYYVQNAHGDVVNLVDADGAVTKTYHYDAFGVELSPVTGDINVFRYCGEYFDTETGSIYLRARYYQASIGRFTQRDTVTGKLGDPLSLNLYTYCHNNPIVYQDHNGHWIIWDWYMDYPYKAYEKMGEAWYDFDAEFTDNWYIGIDYLRSGGDVARSFGMWSESVVYGIYSLPDTSCQVARAAINSTEIEFGVGAGLGGGFELGQSEDMQLSCELYLTPFRDEYIINSKTIDGNITGMYSAGITVPGNYGFMASKKVSAVNNGNNHNPYFADDRKWETNWSFVSGSAEKGNNGTDLKLTSSSGLYLGVGFDYTFSFDCSNFFKEARMY